MINLENYHRIKEEAGKYGAEIIAVSKKKSVEDIRTLMDAGQKKFGENYVQELVQKQKEIQEAQWHFIGHLQTNKVKQIIPLVSMIQSIDSLKLMKEVDKQSRDLNRKTDCLLEVHIAKEESKSGFSIVDIQNHFQSGALNNFPNVTIRGLMGMATMTEDNSLIREEFRSLRKLFEQFKSPSFDQLSMGMTSDYRMALEEGSTMIRIGSAIFGERN